ncbi:hypothetical protein QBC47DRAFT_372962 [Echria macrotheca]|uniref:Phytanoyl-CoA dioxygenase family protein n=1 Tax=Echria macrotheca TaxID=438768 RepID=A0AAJ0BK37_9PEZI|nr:hypothetical protein QBC47DRAFT_372962 [Echria macrotheca]
MELFNMLVRPDSDKKWNLVWHRDDIPPSATPSEEEGVLKREAWHAQWNLALYRDEALEVVPGSHLRARTDVERRITTLQNGDEEEMPGAVKVILEPGDVVFYDSNILHRGVYDPAVERMTLHGSVGHVRGSEARARNVLQHGVGVYVADCDFGCLGGETEERAVAEGMRERLVAMGRERGGEGDVGYSLEG